MRTGAIELRYVGLLFGLAFSAVLLGGLLAFAPPAALFLAATVLAAVVAFATPTWALLLLTFLTATLISGSLEYFLDISKANWFPFILSALIGVRAAFELTTRPRAAQGMHSSAPWFALPAAIYFATLFGSALINQSPVLQVLASVKNYLMMTGVFLGYLVTRRPADVDAQALFKTSLVVLALQLPVVLYQKFFIASKLGNSASGLSYDALNGTFGGGLLGGNSGGLAMYVCVGLGYVLLRWRFGLMSAWRAMLIGLLILPVVLLIEVKAVFLWIPIVFILALRREIATRPVLVIFGLLGAVGVTALIFFIYTVSFYDGSGGMPVSEIIRYKFAYFFDPNRFNPTSRELGRVSTIVHWWRENSISDAAHWLIGYGPGASRSISSIAIGVVALKYPFYVDTHTIAVLLWDVGAIGTLGLLSAIALAFIEATRLAGLPGLAAATRVHLETVGIAMLLILSTTIYSRSVVDGTTVQYLMFAGFAYILLIKRNVHFATLGSLRPAAVVSTSARRR